MECYKVVFAYVNFVFATEPFTHATLNNPDAFSNVVHKRLPIWQGLAYLSLGKTHFPIGNQKKAQPVIPGN